MKNKGLMIMLSLALVAGLYGVLPTPRALAATTAVTYYSTGSVAPNIFANWKTNRDGTGTFPANFTSGDIFVIQNGHNMTTSAAWSISGTGSKLWIENGGTLTATSAVTLASATTFQIDAGGTYVHNNIGTPSTTIFQGTESFASGSTFEINNWLNNTTTIPAPNGGFGNLRINYSASIGGSWNQSGNLTTVNGDLVILSTGTSAQEFRLTGNTNFTLSLAGSLIISGGVLDLANGTGAPTINIGGDFSQSGGTFKSSGSVSTVAFTGANKTFTQSAGTFTTSNIDFTVATGASLTLANDLPVATSRSLTVNGTLNTGTNAVTGAGAFTLASGATLGIGSAGGINSGTSQGNIRVSGTRTFNNGANYIFNGASDQVLGNGFSTTMNNLTIANAGITTNDRANLTVNGNLVVNAGSTFDLSTYSVTSVGGTVTNNGTLKQTKTVAASGTTSFLTIPTAKYYGVDITAGTTALGSTTVAVSGNQVCSQASGYPVKRCFEITPASQQSANIKFYFTNAQMQTDQTLSSLNVWHYNGSTWDSITKGTTGGTSSCGSGAIDCFVEGTGITSYSPFALKNTSPQAVTLADFSAAQSGDAVLLTWETNSELENRGFNLYRGTDPAAPDRQLNDALIPSQSQGNPGGFIYTWEDRADLTPGTTYYYWVEDVDIYGAATRHGPVSVDYGAPTAVRLVDAGAVTALPWAMPLAAVGLLALAALAAVGRRR